MASINLISGGLDVQSIVDSLISVEGQPITRLQQQTKSYQDKISAYQAFNTRLLALKTSLENLMFYGEDVPLNIPSGFADRFSKSLFALRTAASSDETVVTAASGKGAATGDFSVTVSRLAKANSFASNNFSSDTAASTKTGTIVIQKGTEGAVTITVDGTNNTLQGIRNAINNANAGFTAAIVNDGSSTPYRLVLTSDDTGSANALTITPSLTEGTGSDLAFTQTTPADNAAVRINGVDVTSASNTITNAVEGITFNLKAESGTAVVNVVRDVDSIVSGIKEFVAKYNDVRTYINSQSRYDAGKKAAGILAGDFTLRQAQEALSSALAQSISSDGYSLSVLSQIGIKVGNDSTLTVDEAKLKDSLSANFMGTAHLLLADAADVQGRTVSLVPNLQSRLSYLTDSIDGPVFHATDAIQQNIRRINEQIEQMQARLDARREVLIAQYTQADQALRQLSVLQTSLSSQLNTLSNIE